jgi:hypothetical protein
LLLMAAGCPATDGGELEACDPVQAQAQPIELTALLGVGEDENGTLYVADEGDADSSGPRLFISEGNALYRKRVTGSGTSVGRGGDADYTLGFEDGSVTRHLVIEVRAGEVSGMALAGDEDNEDRAFFAELGADAQLLTVLDGKGIANLAVHNLAGDVVIEYLAHTDGGDTLLVTRPDDDWSYEDFRVFYGADNALIERNASMVTRARDGGSTVIAFDVDGTEYSAHFPVVSGDMGFAPGPATLDIGSDTLSLTREPKTGAPSGFTYQCIAR